MIIYRQDAIELVMQYCPDDDGTCSKADEDIRNLLDELENLPSAQSEQRWIPVSERLPEPNEMVLISADGEVDADWIAVDNTGYGCWYRTMKCAIDIDAWMPLPEPWEGEKE